MNMAADCCLPWKMTNGAILSPFPLTVSVTVIVSRFVVEGEGRMLAGSVVTTR